MSVSAIGPCEWFRGALRSHLNHVFFSSVVLALAIWASIRSAALRRG